MDGFIARERAQSLAERQAGRIGWAQMRWLQIPRGHVEGWIRSGHLLKVVPRVYAWGHCAPSELADLWTAVLYAGPGAMLSHITAAWWRRLIEFPAPVIHVSTPRRCLSLPGITVHARRDCVRSMYRDLPVTSIPQTMVDLAGTGEALLVRKALGRLDYPRELEFGALKAICRPGRTGSVALRWAIDHHDARFGATNGPLADKLLLLCERQNVPKPDHVEHRLHGILVDGYYVKAGLVIELDGVDNHRSPAQLRRDHRNELTLRGHGLQVNRYSSAQIDGEPHTVARDILETLAVRAAQGGRGGRGGRTLMR